MSGTVKINIPIIVEGKYDKAHLSSVVDGVIITTSGFGIFKNDEKKKLIKTLGKNGIIILSDSDIVCNIDLADVVAVHNDKNADITMVNVLPHKRWNSRYQRVTACVAEDGTVEKVSLGYERTEECPELCLNIYVMQTNYLRSILAEAKANNYASFTRDILMKRISKGNICRYLYTGYYAFVADVRDYYSKSIELATSKEARDGLLGVRERPIYTNVHNTPPVRYGEGASAKSSMIADGCVIEGTVENSVLFRGVHIGKGSVVRNSILLGGTYVGKNVTLHAVIADKDVLISDGRTLSGCEDLPYYIPKKKHL